MHDDIARFVTINVSFILFRYLMGNYTFFASSISTAKR